MFKKHVNDTVATLGFDDILRRVVSLERPGQISLGQKY